MYDVFRMCELMFETFDVPAVFMSKDAVLSCYAVGRTSGLVIDCGASGKLDHQSPCRI
jgi:actin-related protein